MSRTMVSAPSWSASSVIVTVMLAVVAPWAMLTLPAGLTP